MANLFTITSEMIIGFTKTEGNLMFWISLNDYVPIQAYEGEECRHFVVNYNLERKIWSINISEWDGYSFNEDCDEEFDMQQVQSVCESMDLNVLADHTEYYYEYWEDWGTEDEILFDIKAKYSVLDTQDGLFYCIGNAYIESFLTLILRIDPKPSHLSFELITGRELIERIHNHEKINVFNLGCAVEIEKSRPAQSILYLNGMIVEHPYDI